MPIDPNAIGATTAPQTVRVDRPRHAALRARRRRRHRRPRVHHREQPRHPAAGAADLRRHRLPGVRRGGQDRLLQLRPCCCTDPSRSGCTRRCRRRASSTCVSEVVDIQDKGEGKNAIVVLKAHRHRPGDAVRSSPRRSTTAVIRGEGGFGGQPGERPVAPEIPEREPDAKVALPTREDQAAHLPAVRGPQSAAQRPVVRAEPRGFPEADPARAVHLRGRRSGAGRRTRRWRRHEDHAPSTPGSPRRCSPARR